jgi:hypothetical protein
MEPQPFDNGECVENTEWIVIERLKKEVDQLATKEIWSSAWRRFNLMVSW